MQDSNLLEKYMAVKNAALKTKMIEKVVLGYSETDTLEKIKTTQARTLYIVIKSATVFAEDDNIIFDLIIADKVNQNVDEEYALQSWSNALAAFRMIYSELNYKDGEDADFADIELSFWDSEDSGQEKTMTVALGQIDMAFAALPNIH